MLLALCIHWNVCIHLLIHWKVYQYHLIKNKVSDWIEQFL